MAKKKKAEEKALVPVEVQLTDAERNLIQDPWQRRANESLREFAAFDLYRQYGVSRKLGKVVDEFFRNEIDPLDPRSRDVAAKTCLQWSTNHNWNARAIAWDRHVLQELRQEEADALKAMRRRHRSVSTFVTLKAFDGLQKKIKLGDETGQDLSDLSYAGLIDLIQQGQAMERKSLELPDQTVEVQQTYRQVMTADECAARIKHIQVKALGHEPEEMDESDFVYPIDPKVMQNMQRYQKPIEGEIVE